MPLPSDCNDINLWSHNADFTDSSWCVIIWFVSDADFGIPSMSDKSCITHIKYLAVDRNFERNGSNFWKKENVQFKKKTHDKECMAFISFSWNI